MKNLLAFFILVLTINCNAQDTIQIFNNGNIFQYQGKNLNQKELGNLVSTNREAAKIMRKAGANETAALIFCYAGGFLIGYPVGTAIGGGEPDWALAIGGAGLIGISIPFVIGNKQNTIKAVELYNKGIKIDKEKNISLLPSAGKYGIGLCLKF